MIPNSDNSMKSTQSQSRTISEGVTGTSKRLILSGKYGIFDFLFPLFDTIIQEAALPEIFYYILIASIIFQVILLSMWLNSTGILSENSKLNDAFQTMISIFLFIGKTSNPNPTIIYFCLNAFVVIAYVCITVSEVLSYNSKRMYNKSLLYVFRFLSEIIMPFLIIPSAGFAGYSLRINQDNKSNIQLAFLIIDILFFVFISFASRLTYMTFSISPFLPMSPIASWYNTSFISFLVIEGLFAFMSSFIISFLDWLKPVLFIVNIVTLCLAIYEMFSFDFIKIGVINTLSATMCTAISMDLTAVAYFIFPKFKIWVFLIVAAVTFIVSYYIISLIIKHKINVTNEILTLPEEETDIEAVYDAYKIKTNGHFMKQLLHLGLLNMSQGILNFSLVRYIISNTDSLSFYSDCLKVMCFFPQESRLMSQLFQAMISKKDLKFVHRLMLYQTERIKAVRQSSSSVDSTDLYSHLVAEDRKCANEILGFMKHVSLSIDPVKRITKNIINIENQWIEILNAYPNNTRFRDEYIRFLVDCKSDFTGGIMQKYKKQQIEQGFNFATDRSFRFFISNYPQYLKKKIMDYKGNVLVGTVARKGSQQSSSRNSSDMSNSMSSSNQISAEIEENIGRTMFNAAKTRIGLQNAFYTRKSASIFNMRVIATNIFVLHIIAAAIILGLSFNIFETHERAYKEVAAISEARFATTQIELFIYLQWAKVRGLLGKVPKFDNETDFLFHDGFNKKIGFASNSLIKAYSHLSKYISSDAENGIDVYKAAMPFVLDIVPTYFCNGYEILKPLNRSIPTSLMHMVQNGGNIAADEDIEDIKDSRDLCEIAKNSPIATESIQKMFDMLRDAVATTDSNLITIHKFTTVGICAGLFILTIPPIIIGLALIYKERNKMIMLMQTFTDTQIQEFTRPILIESEQDIAQSLSMDKDENKDNNCLSYIGVFLMEALFIAFVVINIYHSTLYVTKLDHTFDWTILGSLRKAYIEEAVTGFTFSILLKQSDESFDPSKFKSSSSEEQMKRVQINIIGLKQINDRLILGDKNVPSCNGINKQLDRLNSEPSCPLSNEGDNPIHTKLKCGSLTQVIDYLQTISSNQIKGLNSLEGYDYFTIPHSMYNHVFDRLDRATEYITSYGDDNIKNHHTTMIFYMVGESLAALIIFIITLFICYDANRIYTTLLHFFLRIPPSIIISNSRVLNWLLKRDDSADDGTSAMTTSMKVIYNSTDPIIGIGTSNAIEMVNKAVTGLLGYNPEQMLGQSFSVIFNEKTYEEIEKQIQMMKNGQSALTYESHIQCVTDNDVEIKCHLTLIGIGKAGKDSQSFVLILTDEEELLKRQEEAEEAKKKSEFLLYQILPMDIVLRLNSGEKNISLVVPSATIIFVDVQRFSDFASSLSPPQIMGSLSLLFNSYDHLLAKYPLLLKIKLIGDDYMAAGGLFTPDEAPAKHAEQTIRFSFDILQELDEVNNKLSSNMSVRIGINTGGPIIAGVLGTDKPTFDIIGDPINVAARLQSTDIAGRIQISQATYDLVSALDFTFEKRNDVFLKGKGKCATYLVSSCSGFQLALSSSAMSLTNSLVT